MTPKKPDIYKRAKGYGRLAELRNHEEREEDWRPVPAFPEYEVNKNRQVRRKSTGAPIQPWSYPMSPSEHEVVEFWIDLKKYIIPLDTIMSAAFPKED